jgi:hypothetical protein
MERDTGGILGGGAVTKKHRLFFDLNKSNKRQTNFLSPILASFLNVDIFATFHSILSAGCVSKNDKFFSSI